MDREIYKKFARVLVEVGVNLQPGEIAIVQAQPEQYELVREIVRVCYEMGARYVITEFQDDEISTIRGECVFDEHIEYYPSWLHDYKRSYAQDNICVINLYAPNRKAESIATENRLFLVEKTERQCLAGYTGAMETGNISFVKTMIPCLDWAKIVYPQLDAEHALAQLWEKIIAICRLNQSDPVSAWRNHQQMIMKKKQILNGLHLEKLYLFGGKTALEVGLVKGGAWIGGCAYNQRNGLAYVPNIPTEEIFFVPNRTEVHGCVVSTIPLNYQGTLIEDICLEVKDGKVVNFSASRGEHLLKSIIETDAGSCYFGEVSLVTVQSPIYQTGTIFYNTLLDENAACHMALGCGTSGIVKNGYELSLEQRDAIGINNSCIHVDFMIGSPQFHVDGLMEDGVRIPIMRNGDWAI